MVEVEGFLAGVFFDDVADTLGGGAYVSIYANHKSGPIKAWVMAFILPQRIARRHGEQGEM